jgi:hypothetical protein
VIERSEQLLDLKDLSVDRAEHVGGDVWKLFLDLQASEGLAQLPGADLVVQHAREIGRAAAFGKPIEINGTAPMPSLAAPRLTEPGRTAPRSDYFVVGCALFKKAAARSSARRLVARRAISRSRSVAAKAPAIRLSISRPSIVFLASRAFAMDCRAPQCCWRIAATSYFSESPSTLPDSFVSRHTHL